MFQFARRLFADLSVGKKLLIGFGLVLFLTIAVTTTGFFAVTSVLGHYHRVMELSEIDTLILQTRRIERDFAISRTEADAQAVRRGLVRVRELLGQYLKSAKGNESRALQAMDQAASDYLEQFETFVEQQDIARDARQQMTKAANEARRQFETVELDMYDLLRELDTNSAKFNGSDPLALAEKASGLSKRMLDLRSNESLYIIDGSAEALEAWISISAEQGALATNLRIWLDEGQRGSIDAALVSLKSYQDAFFNYQLVGKRTAEIQSTMIESARSALALAEEEKSLQGQAMSDSSRRVVFLLGLMGGVAVLIGLSASLLIASQIVVPLRQTVAFAQRIAEGDLSHDITQQRNDELGQLLAAMQGMTFSLRNLVGRIGEGVSQIAVSADQLSTITAQTNRGVQTQTLETEQTATAMHQMAATVQEVARSAEQASQAARVADLEAQQGSQVVQQAVSQIGELATEVQQSAAAIDALNQESTRIGSVLEVIRGVAGQTNLLALNAAIEAARAGEQGRGFAVVADEVRALACRTHDSTEEIEGLIAGLQLLARNAVHQMESSCQQTQRTVALATEAGDALVRITRSVSTIEQMNQQIAASVEQQSVVAETINDSVSRVRGIGEQSARASQQTAASSAELARLGRELRELVQQFRT
ncbi:HAMP domain-containing methyl-accepting chemotaxis protein [Metapseudomonas sp. CR3202]